MSVCVYAKYYKKGQSSLIYLSLFLYLVSSLFFVSAQEVTIKVINTQAIPVEGMVVFLTPKNIHHSFPRNPSTLIVAQKNKSFAPYVAVTQKGQSIAFENQDNITHHIYSVSGGNRFDFKIKSGHSKSTQQLNHAEEIAMGCNIHDWMSGYVLVVDTPYYTQTNAQGLATMALSVAGSYTLTVWHPQLDVEDYKIEQTIAFVNNTADSQRLWEVKLPKNLLALPEQVEQDEFDFLDEYQ
jgi:hypothetical protein